MSNGPHAKLAELGLTLPEVAAPLASQRRATVSRLTDPDFRFAMRIV